MLRVALAVSLTLFALSLLGGSADAKTPGWVITGGELGSSADHFFTIFSEREIFATPVENVDGWLAGLSPGYDLYQSYGNLAVPYAMATDGPALRYYPDAGLIQRPGTRSWYEASPDVVAAFDHVIRTARVKKALGLLEPNPTAADFRARGLPDVSYWLRPVDRLPLGDPERYSSSSSAACAGCIALPQPSETFVMKYLVETLETPLRPPSPERPAFAIEYYGSVGVGGIGGLLGFYAPPGDGNPGRFWYDSYFYDQTDALSHATTAGFDQVMADALARAGLEGATLAAEDDDALPLSTIVGGGAALALGGVMLATVAATAVVARRRRW